MLAARVSFKDIEKVKRYLSENGFLDRAYLMEKDRKYAYLPVLSPAEKQKAELVRKFSAELVEMAMKKVEPLQNYRSILDKEIVGDVPTSFDTIGNIAILDIKPELVKHEKKIAESLLKANRNITTVLKKSGIHTGEFRTQKLKFLAGIKTKEATYRENNVTLKLDVEKVYFSPRLSTERKRIYQLIKPGENVLVMFSGCGPYPLVISKNTGAKRITGIEKNPVAHRYAEMNRIINHAGNVTFFQGDVRDIIPALLEPPKIGMKSSVDRAAEDNRLKYNPAVYEFYLHPGDLENRENEIRTEVSYVRKRGIPVFVHQPHMFNGRRPLYDEDNIENTIEMVKKLDNIYVKTGLSGYIIHLHMPDIRNKKNIFLKNFEKLKKAVPGVTEHAYFENLIDDFFNTEELIKYVVKKTGMKNICMDIAHAFIVYKSTERIVEMIKSIPEIKYFHIADTYYADGTDHVALSVGMGSIDFRTLIPYLKKGIIEVYNDDEIVGSEMISNYKKYVSMTEDARHFDRILMPLPKGAESFLDLALSAAHKGTIIHFYDFEHESELENANEKVRKACTAAGKKFELIELVKCGQYSPGKYRVCVDFRVLN